MEQFQGMHAAASASVNQDLGSEWGRDFTRRVVGTEREGSSVGTCTGVMDAGGGAPWSPDALAYNLKEHSKHQEDKNRKKRELDQNFMSDEFK